MLEYNGLVVLDRMRGHDLTRYDYRLCHGCGVTYAARRPEDAEFQFLYENFNEFLGRSKVDLVNREGPLTDALKTELDAVAVPWWEVENQTAAPEKGTLAWYIARNRQHVDNVVNSIDVSGFRVLEVRSKYGYFGDILKRRYGAAVACMTVMFPGQLHVINKFYDVDARLGVNFETLEVPFEGTFDLILLTHMLTHALEPRDLLQRLGSLLSPGGYVYIYQEQDDDRLFKKGKNLVPEMRCFHFQQFDKTALRIGLRCNGFDPLFVKQADDDRRPDMACLARKAPRRWFRWPAYRFDLGRRLDMYRQWRDESVLALPATAQSAFADLNTIRTRALSKGYAKEEDGVVRPARRMRMMNEKGYAGLNAAARQQPAEAV